MQKSNSNIQWLTTWVDFKSYFKNLFWMYQLKFLITKQQKEKSLIVSIFSLWLLKEVNERKQQWLWLKCCISLKTIFFTFVFIIFAIIYHKESSLWLDKNNHIKYVLIFLPKFLCVDFWYILVDVKGHSLYNNYKWSENENELTALSCAYVLLPLRLPLPAARPWAHCALKHWD